MLVIGGRYDGEAREGKGGKVVKAAGSKVD